MKLSSLATYARDHCANWLGSYCHEVWTENAVQAKNPDRIIQNTNSVSGRCRLAERNPCGYFRQNVLPAWNCPEFIRESYRVLDAQYEDRGNNRLCPECGTRPLTRRRRICDRCRRQRGRERIRRYRHKLRPAM